MWTEEKRKELEKLRALKKSSEAHRKREPVQAYEDDSTPQAGQAEQGAAPSRPAGGVLKQAVASLTDTQAPVYDPTEGMSGYDKFMAGVGKGMYDVVQGAGNMVGLVDDETIAERQRLDEPLMNTGYGTAGEIVGEMASLAPLGAVTLPLRTAATAMKAVPAATGAAGKLQKTVQALGSPAGRGMLEGAVGGAVVADPNERGSGAAQALIANGMFSALNRAGGRLFKDGLVKKSPEVEVVQEMSRRAGMDDFVPVAQAADTTKGPITANVAAAYKDLLPMIPSARGMLEKQNDELLQNTNQHLINRVFQSKKDGTGTGDVASQVLAETQDMNKAVKAAVELKKGAPTQAQELVMSTAGSADKGIIEPSKLVNAIKTQAKRQGEFVSDMPMYDLANKLKTTTSVGSKGSTIAARDQFNSLNRKPSSVGSLASGAIDATTGGLIRSAASKPVQKALTGDSAMNKALQNVDDMLNSTYSYGSGKTSVGINPYELIRALKSGAVSSLTN